MTRLLSCILLAASLIVSFALAAQNTISAYNSSLGASNQVVFVTTAGWNTVQGKMQLYSRKNNTSPWKMEQEFPVTLGRNGLGFDSKSTLDKPAGAVIKQEGDGRSPAGIFKLGPVFSYNEAGIMHMPFKKVDTTDICVDDVKSAYYNTLVDTDTAKLKDYRTFEYMRRKDELYEYGVWVKYNTDTIFTGNGSCIFLHIWESNTTGTSGCTAMEKANVLKLIHWLDSSKNPVLLQMCYTESKN